MERSGCIRGCELDYGGMRLCGWMVWLVLLPSPALATRALRTDGGVLRDGAGGMVLLRGVNVAGNAKVPPFQAVRTDGDFDPLARWGMNVVRLLFTWEAYEPSRGTYDDAYLAYYRVAVRAAAARGLWVIVDFHQDAFSRAALEGCGEGFPAWAIVPSVTPATPDNGAACVDWGPRLVSDVDLRTTWTAFYADSDGARTGFLAMVGKVAAALVDEPGVIGYDLLNEPGGNEQTEIAPLYEDAARAIRAADPDALLFVSPGAITSAGTPTHLPKPTFGNLVYSPHYYDPLLYVLKAWGGGDEADVFNQMAAVATSWNAPLLLGEFGANPMVDGVDGYLGAIQKQLDLHLASGTQWAYTPGWTADAKDGWNQEDFSIVDGAGLPRANFRPRPFVRRTAGTLTSVDLTDETERARNRLTLTWQHDAASGDTEIFAPADYFGGTISVETEGDVRCTTVLTLVTCSATTSGPKRVRVVAAPRCGLTGIEGVLLLIALGLRRRLSA